MKQRKEPEGRFDSAPGHIEASRRWKYVSRVWVILIVLRIGGKKRLVVLTNKSTNHPEHLHISSAFVATVMIELLFFLVARRTNRLKREEGQINKGDIIARGNEIKEDKKRLTKSKQIVKANKNQRKKQEQKKGKKYENKNSLRYLFCLLFCFSVAEKKEITKAREHCACNKQKKK